MRTFISYSSQDQWFAEQIVNLFDRLGVNTWYDKVDLFIGDNFLEKIHEGLKECTHLVVVLSKNSINSRWVREELTTFYNKYVEGKKIKVYPFLLEDVWNEVPPFLQKFVYADFRNSSVRQLNAIGIAAVEKEFLGMPTYEGKMFRCYRIAANYRVFVDLPNDKTKTEINQMARAELDALRFKLIGQKVLIGGRLTYTLALMIGAYLGNICQSISAYDPRYEDEVVPIFLATHFSTP